MGIRHLRNALVSGLLLLAPVGVTLFVFNFLIERIGTPTRRFLFDYLELDVEARFWVGLGFDLAALLLVLVLIALLGWFSQRLIGRALVNAFERLVDALPVIRTIYNTVKQIRDTFVQQQKAVFQQTVLIEYPRKGVWVLGFLTGEGKGEPQRRTNADLLNIFVPTTPNPTSGFLLMVPREEVKFLAMSVGDGMKLIISGGAVVPTYGEEKAPAEATPEPESEAEEPKKLVIAKD